MKLYDVNCKFTSPTALDRQAVFDLSNLGPATLATMKLPNDQGTGNIELVGTNNVQILTGKKMTDPTNNLNARALCSGLAAMGLEPRVPEPERLPPLTAVAVPGGVEDGPARKHLLERFGIEIGGGLGPLKGKVWRIGLMGAGATRRNVALGLTALGGALAREGFRARGDGAAAALATLGSGVPSFARIWPRRPSRWVTGRHN